MCIDSLDRLRAFLGGSDVPRMTTVDDLCAWLAGCAYVHDHVLFQKEDHWQHPDEFAAHRRGDCEDHALFAWRALARLGMEAELVIGEHVQPDLPGIARHAWIVFRDARGAQLLESIDKDVARMVQPLDAVRARYEPHFSVDTTLRGRMYAGWVRWTTAGASVERVRRLRNDPRRCGEPPLDDVDFGRAPTRWWQRALLVLLGGVAAVWLALILAFGFLALAPPWNVVGPAVVFAFVAWIVRRSREESGNSARLAFGESGITLRHRRGSREIPWKGVARAWLVSTKGALTLRLATWDGARLTVPLADYRRARSLFAAIEERLPVAVGNAPLAGLLRDA